MRIGLGIEIDRARTGLPQPQQLTRVVPFVERMGGIDALIALQADERSPKERGQGLGGLRLTHPGRALQKQRFAKLQAEKDGNRQPLVDQIAHLGKASFCETGRRERRIAFHGRPSRLQARATPRSTFSGVNGMVSIRTPTASKIAFAMRGDVRVGAHFARSLALHRGHPAAGRSRTTIFGLGEVARAGHQIFVEVACPACSRLRVIGLCGLVDGVADAHPGAADELLLDHLRVQRPADLEDTLHRHRPSTSPVSSSTSTSATVQAWA